MKVFKIVYRVGHFEMVAYATAESLSDALNQFMLKKMDTDVSVVSIKLLGAAL